MKNKYKFECVATGIGSMPHKDPVEACRAIERYLPQLPHWPQLPKRTQLENMYAQFSEGFPGVNIDEQKVIIKRNANFDEMVEKIYDDYAENRIDNYSISAACASGLYAFKELEKKSPPMVKGQVTGPISWGLSVLDEQGRGILYDDLLAETASRLLHLKAAWQERFLRSISRNTVIFVDEPYLASLGSAFVAISNQQVSSLLEEVLSGIHGIRGIHCCGATDWSLLLNSSTDILSFDTYNYADSFSCYPAEVKAFLKRGGTIAWGVVPNDEYFMERETLSSIMDRLGEAIAPHTHEEISFKQIVSQSIVTPSCSLASMSIDAATYTLQLLSDLSSRMRSKYL